MSFDRDDMLAIRDALRIALDETALGCPYLLQNGGVGNYGANTCNGGCDDEPICLTNSYPRLPDRVLAWLAEDDA